MYALCSFSFWCDSAFLVVESFLCFCRLFCVGSMSSYVGNSFCKPTHDASSFTMHTFGNYGSLSEFHQSNYAYGGLDLSGALASQVSSNSPKREAMSTHDRARINAPPPPLHRQSCAAVGSPRPVSPREYNLLGHGLLSQKAEEIMEVMEKPNGKRQAGDVKVETTSATKQQTNSTERQTQSQPQIYPWMTKLHISHGKVTFNVFLKRAKLHVSRSHHHISFLSMSLSLHTFSSWVL